MEDVKVQNTGAQPVEKERGVWLTIFLVYLLIISLIGALTYLIFNESVITIFPDMSIWAIYLYGLLGLINFISVISLFMWKKWAFFTICTTAVITLIMNLLNGLISIPMLIGPASIPIILYFSMKSRWDLFE